MIVDWVIKVFDLKAVIYLNWEGSWWWVSCSYKIDER